MTTPTRTKPALAAAMIAGSFGMALAGLEISCHLLGVGHPQLYQADSLRGWKLRTNIKTHWSQEGSAEINTNSAGYRDQEWASKPAPGVLRIAVMGDSFTEGLQVPLQKTWVKQLPHAMSQEKHCPLLDQFPKGVETLSFGVGGYGTGQSWISWNVDAKQFYPQLVLHAIYFENDLRDNLEGSNGNDMAPTFFLKDNQLHINRDFLLTQNYRFRRSATGQVSDWIISHSRLAQLLNQIKNSRNQRAGKECPQSGCTFFPLGPDGEKLYGPDPGDLTSAWPIMQAILQRWQRQARSEQSQLVVASLTTPPQMWPNRRERAEQAIRHQLDWMKPEKTLAKLLAKDHIPYIATAPSLQRQTDQSGLISHGFRGQRPGPGYGHWNVDGHRAASKVIARGLCAIKLTISPSN